MLRLMPAMRSTSGRRNRTGTLQVAESIIDATARVLLVVGVNAPWIQARPSDAYLTVASQLLFDAHCYGPLSDRLQRPERRRHAAAAFSYKSTRQAPTPRCLAHARSYTHPAESATMSQHRKLKKAKP